MPSEEPKLVINEIFGPTVQGEGPSVGQRAVFLRVGGCPLSCVWCDTQYTWNWNLFNPPDELHPTPISEVVEELLTKGIEDTPLLVLTGGEPMAQAKGLGFLLDYLSEYGVLPKRIEVETAGVLPPFSYNTWWSSNVYYNVSPKLENSGNSKEKRFKGETLRQYVQGGRSIFKFVASGVEDFKEILELQLEVGIPDSYVWIQPEGVKPEVLTERLKSIAPEAIARGWNISPRLQIFIWGNRRGV